MEYIKSTQKLFIDLYKSIFFDKKLNEKGWSKSWSGKTADLVESDYYYELKFGWQIFFITMLILFVVMTLVTALTNYLERRVCVEESKITEVKIVASGGSPWYVVYLENGQVKEENDPYIEGQSYCLKKEVK